MATHIIVVNAPGIEWEDIYNLSDLFDCCSDDDLMETIGEYYGLNPEDFEDAERQAENDSIEEALQLAEKELQEAKKRLRKAKTKFAPIRLQQKRVLQLEADAEEARKKYLLYTSLQVELTSLKLKKKAMQNKHPIAFHEYYRDQKFFKQNTAWSDIGIELMSIDSRIQQIQEFLGSATTLQLERMWYKKADQTREAREKLENNYSFAIEAELEIAKQEVEDLEQLIQWLKCKLH